MVPAILSITFIACIVGIGFLIFTMIEKRPLDANQAFKQSLKQHDKKQTKLQQKLLNEMSKFEDKFAKSITEYIHSNAKKGFFDLPVYESYFCTEIKKEYVGDMMERLQNRFERLGYKVEIRETVGGSTEMIISWDKRL